MRCQKCCENTRTRRARPKRRAATRPIGSRSIRLLWRGNGGVERDRYEGRARQRRRRCRDRRGIETGSSTRNGRKAIEDQPTGGRSESPASDCRARCSRGEPLTRHRSGQTRSARTTWRARGPRTRRECSEAATQTGRNRKSPSGVHHCQQNAVRITRLTDSQKWKRSDVPFDGSRSPCFVQLALCGHRHAQTWRSTPEHIAGSKSRLSGGLLKSRPNREGRRTYVRAKKSTNGEGRRSHFAAA